MSDECDADVIIKVPVSEAFANLLQRQATRDGVEVHELMRNFTHAMLSQRFGERWKWVECEVAVELPLELYQEAHLWATHHDEDLDNVLFNVVSWEPTWTVADNPLEEE